MRTIPLAAAPALALLLAAGGSAQAPDTVPHGDLEWREIVPGVAFAAAYGDWEREAHGKFVRIDSGANVPLHTHGHPYHAVLISGRLTNNFADGARVELSPGDYWLMAAGRAHGHDCLSEEPCLAFAYGDALWDIALYETD